MDFIERIQALSKRIPQISASLQTEEATKNALVMPFLSSVLGYDVFNPDEVLPEYTADTPTKKGEKVDYALMKDGEVLMLIECKKYNEKLSIKHASQLFRYFSVTKARIAILTNGVQYLFFTDLDAPNKMDEKPFLVLDLENIDEHIVPEVKKLTTSTFDMESIVNAAGELKYLSDIKRIISDQFKNPEEEFVRFFASRVYDGMLTPKVKQQFTEITAKALKQFMKDGINERLKSAMGDRATDDVEEVSGSDGEIENKPRIITTEEEVEGYNVIKAILRQKVDVSRITGRDTQSYFGVLLDNNNRKPICRLHFNTKQKYLGLMDHEKNETRHPLDSVDDIFLHSEALLQTITFYE
ncbi:restriction endonuclease [Shewanella algae]|uniref:type I restriction endonuclease n=1 Tax=Shewanella algae TaxID=38313 RepID=UPI0011842F86|nr:type I restriction endonuclease [Shewanella algae]TVL10754.1 restriction endonuclease [Shewanella algae]